MGVDALVCALTDDSKRKRALLRLVVLLVNMRNSISGFDEYIQNTLEKSFLPWYNGYKKWKIRGICNGSEL